MFKVPFVKIFVSPLRFCSYDLNFEKKSTNLQALYLWFLALSCDLPQGDSDGMSVS